MTRPADRVATFPQGLVPHRIASRMAALPPPRQERIQDLGLGVALAAVNVVSLLPYRAQLHPPWLALTLVAAQGIPLIWRRSRAVGVGLVIGAARVAYDAIFQALIFLTALAAGVLSRTKRASLQAAQSRADRAEAELDRQVSRAAAAERVRIARELHDVVAHHVSLMAVQAEAATSLLPDRPDEARRSVGIIGDTARLALTELRRLLGVLRGPSERLETAPSASLGELGEVLDQVREAGLPVDFEVVGTPCPLAPGVDLTAYRIVQEALTNTIRHARASRAAVTLSYEPGYVTVRIADSGRRRNEPAPSANGGVAARPGPLLAGSGLGLAGIAERVASCGGNLTVGPTGSDGFAVTARLPSP